MKRLIVAVMAAGVLVMPCAAQNKQPARVQHRAATTMELLNMRVPEVRFEAVPMQDVMEWLEELTGVNIVVRWQQLELVGIEKTKPITVKAKNLRLSYVMSLIMGAATEPDIKLAYRATANLIIFSTDEDLGKDMITRVYDVGDLLLRVPRFTNAAQLNPAEALNQAGQGGFTGGGGGGGNLFEQEESDQDRDQDENQPGVSRDMAELISVITSTVEPNSWATNGGTGTIIPLRSQIIVRASIQVHQMLGGPIREE
ncbi:MAG: hypothetical protein CHACPFDD_02942 [Phycisphaerae bacterium]|nr:hypothetical protein [Phycisphaerae bacterium]